MPVAPEFQNPLKAPNYLPYFWSTDPAREMTVTVPDDRPLEFSVSVGDMNLGDTLYIRWISDYPPYSPNVTKALVDVGGMGVPFPPTMPLAEIRQKAGLTYGLQCSKLATNMQQHRLVVIVADRPFLEATSGDDRYGQVATRTDGTNTPITVPIIAGWNVTCPPP